MRTDRELLELAAKALGGEYLDHALGGQYLAFPPSWNGVKWSPLEDDGDALRLAVKLGLHVKVCRRVVLVEQRELGDDKIESLQPDPYAATRRAIVRAAAEIGAAM